MTVATFVQPNFTTQDPATYKAALDGGFAVLARLAGAFAPHAQTMPDMIVRVDAGAVFNGTTLTEIAAQNAGPIAAPAANPRRDIVYIDRLTGAVGVVTGAESASPVDPSLPAGKVSVARINLVAGMAAITNSVIDDLRAWPGSPIAASESSAGVMAIATQAEINAGTSDTEAVTPLKLATTLRGQAGSNIASTSTINLPSTVENYFNIIGATGISAISTRPAGSRVILRFSGALILIHSATSLILPGGTNIVTAAGDIMPIISEGAGNWRAENYIRASGKALTPSIVQVLHTSTSAYDSTTAVIPYDDSIPQNTEGKEIFSQAIVPKDVNNILIIEVILQVSTYGADIISALFRDSTTDALAAGMSQAGSGSGQITSIVFRHKSIAGTTSAITLKVRYGPGAAGTASVNGTSSVGNSSRRLGGVMASSMTITEMTA